MVDEKFGNRVITTVVRESESKRKGVLAEHTWKVRKEHPGY